MDHFTFVGVLYREYITYIKYYESLTSNDFI